MAAIETDKQEPEDSIVLAQDQEEAFRKVLDNNCVFITGPAGTGKSVLIKKLEQYYQKRQVRVHLCSSTGVSAYLIGGMTVHAFMKAIQNISDYLLGDDVIIIDEISMLGRKVFEELNDVISDYYRKQGKSVYGAFAGQKIILVGDFAQLPPVNDEFCFNSELWTYVEEEVKLTEIKRQKEKEFSEFLLRVRSGKLSMADRKRIYRYQAKPIESDSIQLYPTNEKARLFNHKKLQECSKLNKSEIITYPATISQSNGFTQTEIDEFMKTHVARFYNEIQLCEGAKVLLTANLNVSEGWVNGSICTIAKMTDKTITLSRTTPNQMVVQRTIERELYTRSKRYIKSSKPCNVLINAHDHTGKPKRQMCGKIYCTEHCEIIYTDRDGTEYDLKPNNEENMLVVAQFPLLLAWAMTIHKAQGSTIDKCTVHLSNMKYTPSLFYVAVSRCKTEEGLVIRSEGPIQYDQICPDYVILEKVFQISMRKCGMCQDNYIGPYNVCQDCSSAPGQYSIKCFKEFADKPTEDMLNYIEFALSHKEYQSSKKWKKFVQFLEKEYRINS